MEDNRENYSYEENPYTNQGQYGGPKYGGPEYGQSDYGNPKDERGKKYGNGFGMAALILGIISLVVFCSIFNVFLAILAIVFGIIQLAMYHDKVQAIIGIVTASLSIVLTIVFWGLIYASSPFMNMMEDFVYEYSDGDYNIYEYGDGEMIDELQQGLEQL